MGGEICQTEVNGNVRVIYYPIDDKDSTIILMNSSEEVCCACT